MRWFIILCVAVLVNNVNAQNQIWQLYSAVTDLPVGPESAVHCQLTSPSGAVTFNGFGQCKVNIPRVNFQHAGVWIMSVTLPENVVPVRESFTAQLATSSTYYKKTVTTSVQEEQPTVELTCAMVRYVISESITACVFHDPAGRALQAREGVSEDRYSFIESSTAGLLSCGLAINETLTSDLGLWRCDLQTATDTYYGHLSVLSSWAMEDPDVAESVISVPALTSQTGDQIVVEGDSVTMSCSIQSTIQYCYFRAENGTIYNVRPGISSPIMEYVGSGLDAGECGIRFLELQTTDSGSWSCLVGLPDSDQDDQIEQQVQFSIQVEETMSVSLVFAGRTMVLEAVVAGDASLDYCRFVRSDGVGFTSNNMPAGYSDSSSLSRGKCGMHIADPVVPRDYAWTVVAKVYVLEEELARYTEIILPERSDSGSLWWLYAFVIPGILVLALLVGYAVRRSYCSTAKTVTA